MSIHKQEGNIRVDIKANNLPESKKPRLELNIDTALQQNVGIKVEDSDTSMQQNVKIKVEENIDTSIQQSVKIKVERDIDTSIQQNVKIKIENNTDTSIQQNVGIKVEDNNEIICKPEKRYHGIPISQLPKKELRIYNRMIARQTKKKEKRAKKRLLNEEKRREAKLKYINLGLNSKDLKLSRMEDSKCKIGVVIDLSFDDLMINKDMGKVIQQISQAYTVNRRSKDPMQLHLTSFEGRCKEVMEKKYVGYEQWDINYHSEKYLDIFPKEKLVYLTRESNNIIDKLEDDKVYVIGGLVDHNRCKGICYKKAVIEGIKHEKLVMRKHFSVRRRTIFTINQVFEVLLRVSEGNSFQEAFLMVLPKRKNVQPTKQELNDK